MKFDKLYNEVELFRGNNTRSILKYGWKSYTSSSYLYSSLLHICFRTYIRNSNAYISRVAYTSNIHLHTNITIVGQIQLKIKFTHK